jgi:hypothetical protein
MTAERRGRTRYNVWFMMKLAGGTGGAEDTLAVSHNASETGLLLATATKLEVGAAVKVKIKPSADADEREIDTRIVRVEQNPHDTMGLWPWLVAVELIPPLDALDKFLEDAATRNPGPAKPDDRRVKDRYSIWFPLKVESPSLTDGVAVSRNISETGVLMLSATKLDPGSVVNVTFKVEKAGTERTAQAKIVRMEKNTGDQTGLWPWRVAVEFIEPVPELEPMLHTAEKKGDGV